MSFENRFLEKELHSSVQEERHCKGKPNYIVLLNTQRL